MLAFHGRNPDLGSHGRLRDGDRNDATQIVPLALKERMFLDVQHDVQITGRAAKLTHFPRASKSDTSAVFDTGRNLSIDRTLTQDAALPFAFRARIGDHAAGPLTGRTRTGDAEESLLIAHLSSPVAGAAGGWAFARGRPGAAAILAGFVAANSDLSLGTEECFFKLERQILAQVRATLHAAAPPATTPAKQVAKSKELPEDVVEILEDAGIKTHPLPGAAEAGMPVAIVNGALFRVGKNRVSLTDFLEFLFGVGVVRVPVGMELQGKLAVGALQLHLGGRAAHAQHVVIIAFRVRRQNRPFP